MALNVLALNSVSNLLTTSTYRQPVFRPGMIGTFPSVGQRRCQEVYQQPGLGGQIISSGARIQ